MVSLRDCVGPTGNGGTSLEFAGAIRHTFDEGGRSPLRVRDNVSAATPVIHGGHNEFSSN